MNNQKQFIKVQIIGIFEDITPFIDQKCSSGKDAKNIRVGAFPPPSPIRAMPKKHFLQDTDPFTSG